MSLFFFFNDTATTEIYTLSLHDALPIYWNGLSWRRNFAGQVALWHGAFFYWKHRSEEHTSELQSQSNLVCRLLLEKKKASARPGTLAALPAVSRCKVRPTSRHAAHDAHG